MLSKENVKNNQNTSDTQCPNIEKQIVFIKEMPLNLITKPNKKCFAVILENGKTLCVFDNLMQAKFYCISNDLELKTLM